MNWPSLQYRIHSVNFHHQSLMHFQEFSFKNVNVVLLVVMPKGFQTFPTTVFFSLAPVKAENYNIPIVNKFLTVTGKNKEFSFP